MSDDVSGVLTRTITDFLNRIGLSVRFAELNGETFLPGILVEDGCVVVDLSRLEHPGDLLHEAGHLALASPELRRTLNGEVTFPGAIMEPIEAQAMAWSYAAALHLGIDPATVFHDKGYRGDAKGLLFNFEMGVYIGVNGLEDAGLTCTDSRAAELNTAPFPHMLKWLRD